jgi:hypothetical protein
VVTRRYARLLGIIIVVACIISPSSLALLTSANAQAAARQDLDPLSQLGSELPPYIELVPLATFETRWTPEELVCFDEPCGYLFTFQRIPLEPNASHVVGRETTLFSGLELLYAEGTTLTLEGSGGTNSFGPEEQASVVRRQGDGLGAEFRVTNNSTECGTLSVVTVGLATLRTGMVVPPLLGPAHEALDSCGGDPENINMWLFPDASEEMFVFITRLTWTDNAMFGTTISDPLQQISRYRGPVAVVVDSGQLTVYSRSGPAANFSSDGWLEIRPGSEVGMMRYSAIDEDVSVVMAGVIPDGGTLIEPVTP